jgi:hypothetical protein
MGAPRLRSGMAGRLPMRSPGRPPVARREGRQRFWMAIAHGLSSEDAAVVCGVSPAVGARWFRQGGGMPSTSLAPLSGRYLWFTEREEITVLKAKAVACARSLAGSAVQRRPSRERYAATLRPVAACWRIEPRPRSGTRIGVPSARRWPPSPVTTGSGRTCGTGLPG